MSHFSRAAIVAALASSVATAACASKQSAEPSTGTYTIAFPSTAAAVSTDTVKVIIFDVADAGVSQICTDLVLARRSNQALPTPLAESKDVSPCDLLAGKGQITLSYGQRAVLAVAQKAGADYLIGCAVQNVGEGSTQVPVQLALASTTVSVPPTPCASLSDHCGNHCPSQ
jgi:hypothetical protein